MPTLRLVSVDARSFPDRAALSAALAAETPQVAVVHHAPHLARWRSLAAEIARGAGLVVVGGGRTGGANLLLSDLAVDVTATHDVLLGRNPLRPTGFSRADLRYRGAAFTLIGASSDGDAARLDAALPDTPALVSRTDGTAVRIVVPAGLHLAAERAAGPLLVRDLELCAAATADDPARRHTRVCLRA
ncbi:MAG: hypothetical protein ACTHMS_21375 [Jatrophihabitans sp.]|uniref:hypothetical protein n=1 Tax=Jatrophihabitans sp. TaxID=1932789 RepID=UPI003F7E8194